MFNLFCDSRKTEFRDAEATGTVKANLNKTSRSEKTWSDCLVDCTFPAWNWGCWNMFLAVSVVVLCLHSIVTGISQTFQQFIGKETGTVWTECTECVQYGITSCKAVFRFSCHRIYQ